MRKLRLRYCYEIEKGKVPKNLYESQIEGSFPYLSMEYIRNNQFDTFATEGVKIPKNSCCLLWDGANAGETFINKDEGYLASTCAVLKPKGNIVTNMAKWYLSYFEDILRKQTNGMGIPHVNGEVLKNQLVPYYSEEEQITISNYLDKKVSAIDNFIKKEEKAISELKEYSVSLISDAVTKGLKNEPLRNNKCSLEIEKLPCSWNKNKLVRLAYCKSGSTPDRSSNYFWDNPTINWMVSGEVNKKYVYDTDEKISEWAFKKNSLRLHPINTVMLALNGQGKTKGMVAITKIKTTCNQSLLGMTCDSRLYYKFLYYYFRAVYKPLRSQVGDKSREGLSGDFIKSLVIPLPDIKEQLQIVDYLDKKCDAIDNLIKLKEQKIEKLKEYKKSLIFECVTGSRKITCQMN